MRNEADQLLEDLEYIRSNAGTLGPDHPKFKRWVAEVRGYITHEGNTRGLKQFEQLEFVRGGSEMWSQYVITQGNIQKFKADLDKVEAILLKMGGHSRPSTESSADQKMRELFLTSTEESAEGEKEDEEGSQIIGEPIGLKEAIDQNIIPNFEESIQEETVGKGKREITEAPLGWESAMDQKIEPNFEAVTKQHLSSSAREQAVDRLMAELNTEMKSSDPDWTKVQRIMGEMMGLKKTGELLERLKADINTPGVQWETVRKIMAQLWSIKKEIVIDLLPTLLKS